MASGLTQPFGWPPAEKARKRPLPSLLAIASARIERAEFPVQRKRILRTAGRAYVLETGRIILSGTGESLLADDRVRQAYLGM